MERKSRGERAREGRKVRTRVTLGRLFRANVKRRITLSKSPHEPKPKHDHRDDDNDDDDDDDDDNNDDDDVNIRKVERDDMKLDER